MYQTSRLHRVRFGSLVWWLYLVDLPRLGRVTLRMDNNRNASTESSPAPLKYYTSTVPRAILAPSPTRSRLVCHHLTTIIVHRVQNASALEPGSDPGGTRFVGARESGVGGVAGSGDVIMAVGYHYVVEALDGGMVTFIQSATQQQTSTCLEEI